MTHEQNQTEVTSRPAVAWSDELGSVAQAIAGSKLHDVCLEYVLRRGFSAMGMSPALAVDM